MDPSTEEAWFVFEASDGLNVRVRRERPDDAPFLIDLFDNMGPTSRYLRFSKALGDPDPERVRQEAERLATLQPPKDVAWLAFADLPDQPDTPIAGARYTRLDDTSAEMAISVRDDMQRRGIGSALLHYLAEQARRDGVERLVAVFRSENRAVWALLRHSPYPVTWQLHGPEAEAAINLTAAVADG